MQNEDAFSRGQERSKLMANADTRINAYLTASLSCLLTAKTENPNLTTKNIMTRMGCNNHNNQLLSLPWLQSI
jgi:hypothetical protein